MQVDYCALCLSDLVIPQYTVDAFMLSNAFLRAGVTNVYFYGYVLTFSDIVIYISIFISIHIVIYIYISLCQPFRYTMYNIHVIITYFNFATFNLFDIRLRTTKTCHFT